MKNRTLYLALGVLSISVFPSSAHAKWQYAEWGMTPAEVEAASEGKAPQSAGRPNDQIPGYEIGNEGIYNTKTHNFATRFYFKGGKLEFVRLVADKHCDLLFNQLQSTYGKPAYDNRSPIVRQANWRDDVSKNKISVSIIGADTCSIDYEGLSQNSSGL